jgi:hypothetical protein
VTPKIAIRSATTTKVYGWRIASRTIHMVYKRESKGPLIPL